MPHYASPAGAVTEGGRSPPPRTTLRVRNAAAGLLYHLVFEGDVQRLSGRQLRHHLARISHVPATEQQLFVHGQLFAPDAVGASVGLREEDVVDLVQVAENVRDDDGGGTRGGSDSVGTESSPPPSSNAGTLSPKMPWQSRSRSEVANTTRRVGGAISASASRVSSTASASTRRAPSPDRLVNALPFAASGGRGSSRKGNSVEVKLRTEPQLLPRHRPPLNDSSLPLWTSATTLSSLPSGNWPNSGSGDAESPLPQMPSPGYAKAASPPHAYPELPSQPPELLARPLPSQADLRQQWSYEVGSPPPQMWQQSCTPFTSLSPLNAPPPLTSQPRPASHREAHAEPAAGLNYSHYDDRRSAFREQASHDLSPTQRAPKQQQVYRPRVLSPGSHDRPMPHASAPVARGAVIHADELETILDEQNYIWQMEEYRFRTERQKRLTALQHRQHELALESARYDQAVAEVERQLARERRKLEELQKVMSHNTTTSSLFDHGDSLQEPPTVVRDVPQASMRKLRAVHHGQALDYTCSGLYDAPYCPTGAPARVSAKEEEEVITEV
ncbi:hypothetical protein, conserved [Leishmania tarentolae]|uniref:Ubiquitin-like domain-containing protein n=1 Tax=Leishmania tarentolae TaxID=5689 RepID=A0A640KJV9_LEITA|nr:hypothetical protein, conserved [Leishmania tarentolae]